ncbi:hypothetical protein CRG98_015579 [Punica granatum]|uniref:Uncharacterized protein n=1 Tax=Punica granatum TaxID=22663 RepID=A0A2I0K695_PUNGR|nr:hypothetical protein CRG98_015579 [Punica granatum]
MARAFNARVRHREFKPGDLVLRKVLHITPDSRGKFAYKSECTGPRRCPPERAYVCLVRQVVVPIRVKDPKMSTRQFRQTNPWAHNQRQGADFVSIFNCFWDFASKTSCPSSPFFELRVQDFVSIFTAFRTSCPGPRVHLYCILDFASASLLHFGLRVHIHCIPDFVFESTAFRTSCPHLLLPDFMSAFTAF